MKANRLTFLILALFLLACGKTEYSDIPSTSVNLTLDLAFKDKELNSILAHKIYTKNDINTSFREYVGYGGVLVFHGTSGFLAYDAACPYEIDPKIIVHVDSTGVSATCSKCGSQFSLEAGGAPMSGPSTEDPGRKRLRQFYNITNLPDNKIRITN